MKILITGPQGCGKTTQAKILSEKYGLCLVKTGDILRKLSESDSEMGRKIKLQIDQGGLVDDEVVADIVKQLLKGPTCKNGLVMDGYPRTMASLKLFDPKFDIVFLLNLSDAEATKKMLGRGREDDTESLIRSRLFLYHEQTAPIIAYYRSLGILNEIDAVASVKEISSQIFAAVDKKYHPEALR